MNKILHSAVVFLLIAILVCSLAACGQRAAQPEPVTETKEIVVETPPPSPTPTPTPTPSVPPVAVTTVPMPMPSVSPTVAVTTTPDPENPTASPAVSPTVQPSPSATPNPTPTPYSADAAFASTIQPDNVTVPDNTVEGTIIANGVNFRGGPSDSARILGTYDRGTRVRVIGTENGWTEVIINGVTGYIRSEYVSRGTNTGTGSGSGTIVAGGDSTGIGTIILPDGPITDNYQVAATPTPDGGYFLGILPD